MVFLENSWMVGVSVRRAYNLEGAKWMMRGIAGGSCVDDMSRTKKKSVLEDVYGS